MISLRRFPVALLLSALFSSAAVVCAQESQETDSQLPDWVRRLPSTSAEEQTLPEEERPDWVRLEPPRQLTTEEQADREVMISLALSGRREDQLFALREIEELVGSGAWDASTPYAQEVIATLTLGSYRRQLRPEGDTPDPTLRLRGTRLLGELGGRRSELLIRDILRHEADSTVRAEAVAVLGRLQVELDQELRDLLILSIRRELAREPDPRFVAALYRTIYIADGIGAGIEDPELFYALLDVVERVGSRRLREEGLELLKHLADS